MALSMDKWMLKTLKTCSKNYDEVKKVLFLLQKSDISS